MTPFHQRNTLRISKTKGNKKNKKPDFKLIKRMKLVITEKSNNETKRGKKEDWTGKKGPKRNTNANEENLHKTS